MALGFQSSAFQSPGFQGGGGGVGGGARPVGGWDSDFADRFLRRVKLGNDEIVVEDDGQLEREVAQRIGAIPVGAHSLRWPETPQPQIDWDAVARLRRQAIKLGQPEVEAAIAKAIKEWRDADDEDVMMLASLLH